MGLVCQTFFNRCTTITEIQIHFLGQNCTENVFIYTCMLFTSNIMVISIISISRFGFETGTGKGGITNPMRQ